MKQIPERYHDQIKNILIIGSIGIGNLLMFSGTLRRIRNLFPKAHITIIVLKEIFREIYTNDPTVDEIAVLDVHKTKTLRQKLNFLKNLRKTKYQLCITTFPANRLEYNIIAFVSGADWRVAHKYSSKRAGTMSFLQNIRIPVDTSLHDVEQNLNLLTAFGVKPDEDDHKLHLNLSESASKNADLLIEQKGLTGKLLIGFHPGSSVDRGMILKRWSKDNFGVLCQWIEESFDAGILLFGGPEEKDLCENIREIAKNRPENLCGLEFPDTAAMISKCSLFVSNDSGLMHVAVATGVQTAALFGPSDPGRTAPYGQNNLVIKTGIDCSPCWSINNLGVGSVNCIHPENLCLTQLSVETVKREIESKLKSLVRK